MHTFVVASAFALAILVALCFAVPNAAYADGAETWTERSTRFVVIVNEEPCAAEVSDPELIEWTGTISMDEHVTITAAGQTLSRGHTRTILTGVGLESGDRYIKFIVTSDADTDITATYVNNGRQIALGPATDYYYREHYHYTFPAAGGEISFDRLILNHCPSGDNPGI
jgi:hypothetical protein